jgi:hypothetical protein
VTAARAPSTELHILTEIKNRGVSDVLMQVCDGLKGLPEAVETVWPRTIVQTCVVHLLRNSFRYAARQDWDKLAKLLKPAYTAPTEEAALKCVYMAIMSLDPTGKGQARWTMRWKTALNAFDITFDGRLSATRQQPQLPQLHRSFDRPAPRRDVHTGGKPGSAKRRTKKSTTRVHAAQVKDQVRRCPALRAGWGVGGARGGVVGIVDGWFPVAADGDGHGDEVHTLGCIRGRAACF